MRGKFMANISIGQPIQDFVALATNRHRVQLSRLKHQKVILFFYPKDGTPICTIENQDFSANHRQFLDNNTVVFGVSRDDLASHEAFKKALNIPFELISDTQGLLCEHFSVLQAKQRGQESFQSLCRSTFLIDENGLLLREWRNVSVRDHVHQILEFVQQVSGRRSNLH